MSLMKYRPFLLMLVRFKKEGTNEGKDPAVSAAERACWAQQDSPLSTKCKVSPYNFRRKKGSIIKMAVALCQAMVC